MTNRDRAMEEAEREARKFDDHVEEFLHANKARQGFLLKLADALRRLTDPNEIISIASERLGRYLGAGRCGYGEVDATGEFFVVRRDWTNGVMASAVGTHRVDDFGPELMAHSRKGHTLIIEDARAEAGEIAAAYEAIGGVRAALSVPLLKGGRWVSSFYVQQSSPRRWTADKEVLVREVAERIWAAAERGRAERALAASEARQAFLVRLGDTLRALTDPVAIQSAAVRLLGEHLGASRVHYREIVGDADATISAEEAAVNASAGFRAYIAVPLVKSGTWVAVLAVHSLQPREWAVDDISIVEETAERTWAAVERARAQSDLRESERRQTFLLQFGDTLRLLNNDTDILQAASRLLGECLDVDRCLFSELFPDENVAILHPDYVRGDLRSVTGRFSLSDFRETVDALDDGQPYVIHDVASSELLSDRTRAEYLTRGYASFFSVPLFKRAKLVLNLTVASSQQREWNAAELQLAQEVAERTWNTVERVRAEAALRESEARYRTLSELAPALLWEVDPTGNEIALITKRWREYTGQTLEDSQRGGWLDTVHPDDRARTKRVFAESFASGKPLENEQRIRQQDGAYRWFLVRQLPIRDAEGRVTRWLGMAADIHAQRLALEEVEHLVAERTAERDALRRQLVEAEEAERRRLSRELHDELGQQLTGMSLGLEEARRLTSMPDVARGDVESLGRRLEQLQALTREMTMAARYVALELRPPELDDMGFENALDTFVSGWSARFGVTAEVLVMGEGGEPMPADVASSLYRIAQEALNNVAKHAGAKQVSVIVEKGAGQVRLIVEDDGCGFDIEATVSRARRERRLGIAGMQERAALLRGEMKIESSRGGGTAIFVRLPALVVA